MGRRIFDRDYRQFTRFASLKPFRLMGGEAAMKEPSRSAAAVLWELMGEKMLMHDVPSWNVSHNQREKFAGVLKSGIASPWTTSMGRLFDAVASLTGLCHQTSFEGQAAMARSVCCGARSGGRWSHGRRISNGSGAQ